MCNTCSTPTHLACTAYIYISQIQKEKDLHHFWPISNKSKTHTEVISTMGGNDPDTDTKCGCPACVKKKCSPHFVWPLIRWSISADYFAVMSLKNKSLCSQWMKYSHVKVVIMVLTFIIRTFTCLAHGMLFTKFKYNLQSNDEWVMRCCLIQQ